MHVSIYNHDSKLSAHSYLSPGSDKLPVLKVRDGDSDVTIWLNNRRGVLELRNALDRVLDQLDQLEAEEQPTAAPSQPRPRDVTASLASVTSRAMDKVLGPPVDLVAMSNSILSPRPRVA